MYCKSSRFRATLKCFWRVYDFNYVFISKQVCFSCVEHYVMFWQKRTAVELNTARANKVFGRGQKRQETSSSSSSFWLSKISKPKRRGINYSPSLRCLADRLTVTGDGYGVSVRLQSRHDRGSDCNMFAA